MRKLVTYFPSILVFTLIVWPDIVSRISDRQFPVINIAGFGIRITEILFFFILGIWVLSMLHNKSTFFKKRLSTYYFGNSYILFSILVFFIMFIQGILFNNVSNIFNDMRTLSYFLIIPVFQYYFYKKKYIFQSYKYICIMSTFLFIGHLFFYKSNSQVIYMLFLFLFSMSLSTLILSKKYKFIFLLFSIIASLVLLLPMAKWLLLGILVTFTTIVLLQDNIITKVKIYTVSAFLLFLFILLGGQLFIEAFINRSMQDWMAGRVMRNGGDLSSGRFQMWSESFQNALQHPFWGQGIGYDFMPISRKIGFEYGIGEHSIIIYFLNRVGIVPTTILLYFLYKFFRFCVKLFKNESDIKYKIMILTGIGYFTGYFAICTVENFWKLFESVIILYFFVSMISSLHLFKTLTPFQNQILINHNTNKR